MSECERTITGKHNFRRRPWRHPPIGQKATLANLQTQPQVMELCCICGAVPDEEERKAVERKLRRTKRTLERAAAEEGGTAELFPVKGEQPRLPLG